MTKRGPGAHVLARKGTHEKLEGQLEMSFRPPKDELMLAAYGGKLSSWSRDYLRQIMTYESVFMTDMLRAEVAGTMSGRSTFPMPSQQVERVTATEVARREQDWERGIRMVDFRGRVYSELTEAYYSPIQGHPDILVLDDVG
ncbi:hypothetical protein X747_14360 [Mesorhizobium sp. LNJC384A00]|uniref:hypothetical protein n=1 Tax=Mesorhizobium sp. LNJC384A00 TaxID=1287268 RepID=UPI0003CE8206|nr:hypothetical protein [Mesorhizobium sp. LNJC384A00]ESY41990.1 hypothetical protein X747_14360 [Mesorhizobium sp. LNJC384A00]